MKHLKLFVALFAMLALGVTNAWGDVTCDFTAKSASHSSYTDSWSYGDFAVFGGANYSGGWAYVKMGGKNTNIAKANPVYIASPQMTSSISKVQVSIIAGSLAKSGMSVNSWGVYVYSDADMTTQIDYVAGGTIDKNANVFEFTPSEGTVWAANNYYKVSFDLANTSTTNGIIWLDKITFVESAGDGGGDEPADVIVKTLKSIAVEGMTTNYETGDIFKFDGTCTATYGVTKNDVPQEDETKEVTPTSVSTPDMSTAGEKEVTVTYTEDEATVTATYTINVTENEITAGEYELALNNTFFGTTAAANVSAFPTSAKQDDITVTLNGEGNKTRTDADCVRMYTNNTLTFSVPTGYVITSIEFTEPSSFKKWDGSITVNVGSYSDETKSWAGSAQEVVFSFGAQNRIATATVTYAEAGETPEVPTVAAPTFSLAEDTYTEAQEVTLSAEEGTIYYTLDGTTPDAESIEYTDPIVLDECGTTTINAIAISGETISSVASATYTIKLPLNNSQANPYTEAEAIEVYNGGCYDNQEVYVKGVVANAQFYSSNTYTITLEGGFQFYKFYEAAGEVTFTENYIVAGDTLVACGKLVKYGETYELGAGCYLVERKPYSAPKVDISNTKETAYTVAEAIALIDDITSDLTKQVYVKGEISEVESFNETYGSITYWIQDEEGNKFECYGGLGLDQEKFTSVEDLVVGSQVIVYGTLKKYGSIYEFDANNYLVEYVAPEPEIPTVTLSCTDMDKMYMAMRDMLQLEGTSTNDEYVTVALYNYAATVGDYQAFIAFGDLELETESLTINRGSEEWTLTATIDADTAIYEFTATTAAPKTETIAPRAATWGGDAMNGYTIECVTTIGNVQILVQDGTEYGMGWMLNMAINDALVVEGATIDAPTWVEDNLVLDVTVVSGTLDEYTIQLTATPKPATEIIANATMALSEDEDEVGTMIVSATWGEYPLSVKLNGWPYYGYGEYAEANLIIEIDPENYDVVNAYSTATLEKKEDVAVLTGTFSDWNGNKYALTLTIAEPAAAPVVETVNIVCTDMVQGEEWGTPVLTGTCNLGDINISLKLEDTDHPESVYGEYGFAEYPMGLFPSLDARIEGEGSFIVLQLMENTVAVYTDGDTQDSFVGTFLGSDWKVYVLDMKTPAPEGPSAVDNITTTVAPVKAIVNGQLVIVKDGVQYNAQGAVVK